MAYNKWAITLSPHLELQIVMRNMQAMVYADINCLMTTARFREQQYKNQETKKVESPIGRPPARLPARPAET